MNKKIPTTPDVPSPCISVCTMDEETGYCRGCFRTIEEITDWERYSNERRQQVIDALASRQPAYVAPRD